MLSFSQANTPAVKAHLDAQWLLFSDMSRKFLDATQKVGELNVQAAKAMMEETLSSAQQLMAARDPYEVVSVALTHAKPAAEKARAYQMHLANIAAQSQVEMVKSAETHLPNTARTASAVADEIARLSAEETEKLAAEEAEKPAQRNNAATADQTADAAERGGHSKGQVLRTA